MRAFFLLCPSKTRKIYCACLKIKCATPKSSLELRIRSDRQFLSVTHSIPYKVQSLNRKYYCNIAKFAKTPRSLKMPIDTRELMEAIAIVADDRNVRVAVKQSGKGAAICAACSFAGGMLLGPVGLAVGGAAGGVAAYKMTSGSFRPLGEVIMNDLTDTQREQLVQHVSKAVAEIHPTDVVMLLPLIVQNASIQQAVLNTVMSFVTNELRMQIVD
ncbi:protein C19orf12 homolog [Drosophila eugracilis]|uniref:protein C19orf12 homolog n=1 Tax=Drosophila eugracilis TaxID=29029 RepID=UPI0007E7FAED|nr:protein C19orf12 homolog [Drosophila eugracilis]